MRVLNYKQQEMGRKSKVIKPIKGLKSSQVISALLKKPDGLELKPRSPLRYPGGKSRAVKIITALVPSDTKTIASPFFGGGSIELALADTGIKVYGYDAFEPLVIFWQELIKDAPGIADLVKQYHPLSPTKFYSLQKRYSDTTDRREMAAVFYALNRASFSGATLSGGMSPGHPRFNKSSINRLAEFRVKNLSVKLADFKVSIAKHPDDLLYLDPPYANGSTLYGQKGDMHAGFDHEGLAKMLKTRNKWILSYNDCQTIRDLYSEFKVTTPSWNYGMNSSKKSAEVLITSKDLDDANTIRQSV